MQTFVPFMHADRSGRAGTQNEALLDSAPGSTEVQVLRLSLECISDSLCNCVRFVFWSISVDT